MVLSTLVGQTKAQGVIDLMVNDKDRKYSELSTVKQQENELVPEEFPDGAFGSAIGQDTPVFSKSTSWKKGQRRQSAFIYPDKAAHANLPRQTPGAHPTHDEES